MRWKKHSFHTLTGVLSLCIATGVAGASEQHSIISGNNESKPIDLPAGKAAVEKRPGDALDLGGGVKLELALIPAGKFVMGSAEGEKDHGSVESPPHEVTLSQPFFMGKYEVTQTQYEAVMGSNPSNRKFAKHPVESVSWHDAQEFCRKLSAKAGRAVRLPTEAEWEYACRAGGTTRFCGGDDDAGLENVAWYAANCKGATHAVGEKQANAWGLYDMHGNVWEWCQDWFAEYSGAAQVDPCGPEHGTRRVLRGGSWLIPAPGSCRSASRFRTAPENRDLDYGFRVVVDGVSKTH